MNRIVCFRVIPAGAFLLLRTCTTYTKLALTKYIYYHSKFYPQHTYHPVHPLGFPDACQARSLTSDFCPGRPYLLLAHPLYTPNLDDKIATSSLCRCLILSVTLARGFPAVSHSRSIAAPTSVCCSSISLI